MSVNYPNNVKVIRKAGGLSAKHGDNLLFSSAFYFPLLVNLIFMSFVFASNSRCLSWPVDLGFIARFKSIRLIVERQRTFPLTFKSWRYYLSGTSNNNFSDFEIMGKKINEFFYSLQLLNVTWKRSCVGVWRKLTFATLRTFFILLCPRVSWVIMALHNIRSFWPLSNICPSIIARGSAIHL